MGGSEKSRFLFFPCTGEGLLGAGVLGYRFCAFGDGVFGELTGQEKTNRSLDFAAGDRRTSVVVGETRSFRSDAFENVVDERIHDAHGLARYSSVGVDLLEHFVNVDAVAFLASLLPLFLAVQGNSSLLHGFLVTFRGDHRCVSINR